MDQHLYDHNIEPKTARQGGDIVQRLMARSYFRSPDQCRIWTGFRNPDGYGQIFTGHRAHTELAHRVAFELAFGPLLPADLQVAHHCDEPSCINPEHLFAATNSDNVRDCVAKGRAVYHNSLKTHCTHGHPLDGFDPRAGKRYCKTCKKETQRRFRSRKAAAA